RTRFSGSIPGIRSPGVRVAGPQPSVFSPAHVVRTGGDGTVLLPHAVSAGADVQRLLLPAVRGPGDCDGGAGGGGIAGGAGTVPGTVAAHGYSRIAPAAARYAGQRQRGPHLDGHGWPI